MPRPGFEPGTLDYMTSALPTELSGFPSKQSNNLTHSPSLSIERRGVQPYQFHAYAIQWPTIERDLPSKVGQIHANEFL